MFRAAPKLRSAQRQLITIMLLLAGLGAYVAAFVPAQREFLNGRYFRVLGNMGAQIQETVANLGSALVNATRPPPDLGAVSTNGSVYLSALAAADRVRTNRWDVREQVRGVFDLVPNLEAVAVKTEALKSEAETRRQPGLRFEVVGEGSAARLQITCLTTNAEVVAQSELRRRLEPVVARGEFDDVLIVNAADTNGPVIFQLGGSAMPLARLPLPSDRSLRTNLTHYPGTDYLLFASPLKIGSGAARGPGPADSSSLSWVLCGLVRADRFAAESRSVSYTLLVLFTFLALLLVLSWPFLNVCSQGLKGGLRTGEVFLLIVATVAMNAFLMLMVLDLATRQRLHRRGDEQLAAFAAAIETNVQSELRQIARQLGAINERFLVHPVSEVAVLSRPDLVPWPDAPYPWFGMAVWIDRATGQQLAKWAVKDHNTPLINVRQREYYRALAESRAWFLPAGDDALGGRVEFCLEPIFSATTGEYMATFSMRPAVGNTNDWRVISTLDCRVLSLVNVVAPAGFGYAVVDAEGRVLFHSDERRSLRENLIEECQGNVRLRAAVTGRRMGAVHARYGSRDHTLWVRPLSHLPWSVVTFRDGVVLGTALIEAISVAMVLLLGYCAVVGAGVGGIYATGRRRMLAWLWPSEARQEAYGLLAVANGMLAALFTAAIFLPQGGGWGCLAAVTIPPLAVILCLRTLSRGELGSARLRLVARRSPLRLSPSVGYVLAIGSLLVVVATLPGVAFFRAAFAEETRLLVKHTQLSLAQDLERRAQLLWGQIHGRADLQDGSGHPLRIAPPPGSGGADESPARQAFRGRAGFFNERIENAWDTYSDFFFGTRAELSANWVERPPVGRASGWFSRWLAELRPHYNEQDVLTRRTAGLGADDGAWFWTRRVEGNGPARIELVKDLVRIPGRAGLHQLRISTIEPGWGVPSWPWAVVLLGVVGLPFLVIFILADRLLLLRLARSSVSSAVLDPDRPGHPVSFGPGRYLLVGPPRSGKSGQLVVGRFARLEEGKFRKVDLRNPEDRRWLEPEQVEGILRETHLAVVIDSFEYRHEDPAFNAQKLEFLRQLSLDEARTIVVVTSIHPLHFKLAAPPAEKGATPSGGEAVAAAWVELLACFHRLYVQRPWERCEAPEGGTSLRARVLHRSVWRTCSPAEQELLYQVAQGRLISSAQPELAGLLDRGLLRRTPALQTADESFRRFILQAYRPGMATPDAVAEPPGLWQHLKGPAVTGLLVMAGFFFATQKEMWNHTVALITTFVAGIGAFAKVFELLPKDRPKRPETSG